MQLLSLLAIAQYHPDPFAGSNCTCAGFCAGTCAINATQPQNITLWRMTPGWRGVPGTPVLDMTNKNTGDVVGDSGFVLSRSSARSFFEGDVPNSTDIVLQLTVEVDGQWGPYGACNPPGTQAGDKDANITNFSDFTCQYNRSHHHSFSQPNGPWPPLSAPPPNVSACSCPRMNVTVGRERHSYSPGGPTGYWYSTPMNGQCNGTHRVGDGSGCTWRLLEMTKAINATCLYKQIDDTVVPYGSRCFDRLPDDITHLDSRWQYCFNEAVKYIDDDILLSVWPAAFEKEDPAQGGCPTFQLP